MAEFSETRSVTYTLEIGIAAPTERVWRALTDEIDAWWLPDFHMVGPDSTVRFDAQAGGQLDERAPGGAGLLWYTVLMVDPGRSVHLAGHVGPEWGGPATTMLRLRLDDGDQGCVLEVTDALFGHVTDDLVSAVEGGWRQLFTDGLKRHVETTAGA